MASSGGGLLLAQTLESLQPNEATSNEGEARLHLVRGVLVQLVQRFEFFARFLHHDAPDGVAAKLIPIDPRVHSANSASAILADIDAAERRALVASLIGPAVFRHLEGTREPELEEEDEPDEEPEDADAALFDAPKPKRRRVQQLRHVGNLEQAVIDADSTRHELESLASACQLQPLQSDAQRAPGVGIDAYAPTRTRLQIGEGIATVDVDRADSMTDDARQSLIPIKGCKLLAVPDFVDTSPVQLDVEDHDHVVRIDWDSAWRASTRSACAFAAGLDASVLSNHVAPALALEFVRIDATRFKILFRRGEEASMLIGACSDSLLDQLFSRELPGHASTTLQSALLTRALLHTKLVTSSHRVDAEALRQQAGGGAHVSAVPLIFQQYIAQLAQARLRLHVIATGAVAAHEAAARPLAFDNFLLRRFDGSKHILASQTQNGRGSGGAFPKWATQVKGTLHASSSSCICGAHHAPPVETRFPGLQFTGESRVDLAIEYCGANLEHCGSCPIHREATIRAHDCSPNTCVANIKIKLECRHEYIDLATKKKSTKQGLYLDLSDLTELERIELGVVLSSLSEYEAAARALRDTQHDVNATSDAMLAHKTLLELADDSLEKRMLQFGRTHPAAVIKLNEQTTMSNHDATCVALLRRGTALKKFGESWRLHGEGTFTKAEKRIASSSLPYHRLLPKHQDMPPPPVPVGSSTATHAHVRPSVPVRPMPVRETLIEFLDVDGFAEMRRQIDVQLHQTPPVNDKQRASALFFLQYLDVLDAEAGPPQQGPRGITVRPLACTYRDRANGGRLYSIGKTVLDHRKGEARTVSMQAAPREVRAFLTCRICHDYDMTNAHQTILLQTQRKLTWAKPHTPTPQLELARWVADRDEYINHIAETHGLPPDELMYPDFRKDSCKLLILRLVFGGRYSAWLHELKLPQHGPKSPRIEALATQLDGLRTDMFTSEQWRGFYEADYARLLAEGKKNSPSKRNNSIFARIAQRIENSLLSHMRVFIASQNRVTRTLAFDGLMVEADPAKPPLDLRAMEAYVFEQSGYEIGISEKPLFSDTFPQLCLKR